ncbi:glycoside hydrolase family 81 protein [Favolaschia claudopus]|uniref:Glycoside hydrolase family 81 protein n=1 Tax=Favolaschia claudopus TaxID=2862362 RepID=A0AAW0D7F6_9AGAR
MRFATLAASVIFAAVGVVRAADDRLLYTIPAGDSMDQFTADFQALCSTWHPAIHGNSLTFLQALVEPGDFQGNNADTEAKIVCSWIDPDGKVSTFTKDVAASLGATPA